MNMYKKTFSEVHASDELKGKVSNMSETIKNKHRIPVKWVTAAAAAAFALCVVFHSQLQTFAESLFFKNSTALEDKTVESNMDVVDINQVDDGAWDKKYDTIGDVEELLGVSLLSSDEAYVAPVSSIEVGSYQDGEVIRIYDGYYIAHNVAMDLTQDADGVVFKSTDEGGYGISYSAVFYAKYSEDNQYVDEYQDASFVEDYVTANGLSASVYSFGNEYCALVYHDNICYTFEVTTQDGTKSDKAVIEEFLDTLK